MDELNLGLDDNNGILTQHRRKKKGKKGKKKRRIKKKKVVRIAEDSYDPNKVETIEFDTPPTVRTDYYSGRAGNVPSIVKNIIIKEKREKEKRKKKMQQQWQKAIHVTSAVSKFKFMGKVHPPTSPIVFAKREPKYINGVPIEDVKNGDLGDKSSSPSDNESPPGSDANRNSPFANIKKDEHVEPPPLSPILIPGQPPVSNETLGEVFRDNVNPPVMTDPTAKLKKRDDEFGFSKAEVLKKAVKSEIVEDKVKENSQSTIAQSSSISEDILPVSLKESQSSVESAVSEYIPGLSDNMKIHEEIPVVGLGEVVDIINGKKLELGILEKAKITNDEIEKKLIEVEVERDKYKEEVEKKDIAMEQLKLELKELKTILSKSDKSRVKEEKKNLKLVAKNENLQTIMEAMKHVDLEKEKTKIESHYQKIIRSERSDFEKEKMKYNDEIDSYVLDLRSLEKKVLELTQENNYARQQAAKMKRNLNDSLPQGLPQSMSLSEKCEWLQTTLEKKSTRCKQLERRVVSSKQETDAVISEKDVLLEKFREESIRFRKQYYHYYLLCLKFQRNFAGEITNFNISEWVDIATMENVTEGNLDSWAKEKLKVAKEEHSRKKKKR